MPLPRAFFLLILTPLVAACARSAPPSQPASASPAPPPPPAAINASPPPPPLASPSPTPTLVTFPSGPLTLHGFLWRPPGPGPFPAVVFNHGSERLPGTKEGQAAFFLSHGFVLFVPHRRGQGRSQDAGKYIDDVFHAAAPNSSTFADALVTQSDDVMSAVAYVASLPYVDPKRVAVSGCSLGGIESLFAAERGTGIVAAIDFAGAAATWAGNVPLQERMKLAARNAKVPVFFLQAENDYDTTPSRVLSQEMQRAGKPARVHIFAPNGVTHEEGHSFCNGGSDPPWGAEVLTFLSEAMGADGGR